MNDNDSSREKLIAELEKLKKRNAELASAEAERKRIIDILKESEKRFREIIENSVAGYFFIDTDGLYQQVNTSWLTMHGYSSPGEVIGKHYSLSFSESGFEKARKIVGEAMKGEVITSCELTRRCRDGAAGYNTFSLQPVLKDTRILGVEGIIIDITEQKAIEENKDKDRKQHDELVKIHTDELIFVNEKLQNEIEERNKAEENLILLSSVTQQINDSFIVTDIDFNITFINNAAEELFGYSLFELAGKTPDIFNAEINADEIQKNIYATVSSGGVWKGTLQNKRKDGSLFYCECSVAPILNQQGEIQSFVSVQRDVTERMQAEEKIRASLEEKEILIREIHHRVKNNMQVISSLLSLQAGQIKNKEYFHIFHESINRIKTMSLIHTMLYQSESLSQIKIKHYLPKLCYNLSSIYKADLRGIDINYKISDIFLKIDTAIPCGLIINELVSNAMKYAFPGDRTGNVTLSMRNMKENRIILIVSDDGVGMPEGLNWREADSLGLHLVVILAEGQLQGDIDVSSSEKGTEFRITFER